MMIKLNGQATSTLKIRESVQASNESASILAEHYGISKLTDSKSQNEMLLRIMVIFPAVAESP
ncbi:MAG: hypothetical protein ACTXOO_00425 [Sodalis sp. (in: enterobacteria)]